MSSEIACRLYAAHDLRIEPYLCPEPAKDEALVRVLRAGICGSDLHYYHDGGFGTVRVREPIILGHEAAGVIEFAPTGSGLKTGQLVSLCPSRPCGDCHYCKKGLERHCQTMRFSGSAMRFPHENGFFRHRVALPAIQCIPHTDNVSAQAAATAEPLAVCLHALSFAGDLTDKTVLITGAGPIGAICTALVKNAGAAHVIVTDVQDFPLQIAKKMGADRTVNVAAEPDGLAYLSRDKGQVDVVLECSANAHAIAGAITATRPQGTIVQIGVAGNTALPLNLIVSKEISMHGTHRFDREFARAVGMISAGEIDLTALVTAVLPVAQAQEAFDMAGDRSRAVKVQLDFS